MALYEWLDSKGHNPNSNIRKIDLNKYEVVFYYGRVSLPFTLDSYIKLNNTDLLSFSYNLNLLVDAMINNYDPDHPELKLTNCKVVDSWNETFKNLEIALLQLLENSKEDLYIAFTDPCLNIGLTGDNTSGEFGGWIMHIKQIK